MVSHLYLSAELNNVTELKPKDSLGKPFEFTFKIKCNKCHEIHDKEILINLYEKHEIEGSRGEANFINHCTFCKSKSTINISIPKKFTGYSINDNGNKISILEIDSRGSEIIEFIPYGQFVCKGVDSNTQFTLEFDDGEWYDYDDNAGEEVSITETLWAIE